MYAEGKIGARTSNIETTCISYAACMLKYTSSCGGISSTLFSSPTFHPLQQPDSTSRSSSSARLPPNSAWKFTRSVFRNIPAMPKGKPKKNAAYCQLPSPQPGACCHTHRTPISPPEESSLWIERDVAQGSFGVMIGTVELGDGGPEAAAGNHRCRRLCDAEATDGGS